MRLSFLMLILLWVSCKPIQQSGLDSEPGLNMEGASNTRGVGADFPLEVRLKYHFKMHDVDIGNIYNFEDRSDVPQPYSNPNSVAKRYKVFLSIDYFFPTNFPEFGDISIGYDSIEPYVTKVLDRIENEYDYVFMATLCNGDTLSAKTRQVIKDDSSFEAFDNIITEITRTSLRLKKSNVVNEIIRARAKNSKKFFAVECKDFVEKVVENNGYIRPGSQWNIKPKHLFASDKIHLTNHGQAVLYNYSLRQELDQLQLISDSGSSKLPKMEIPWSYGSAWKEKVIKEIFDPSDRFSQMDNGTYWATLESPDSFDYASARIVGQSNDLELIRAKINQLQNFGLIDGAHSVELYKDQAGKRSLTMDLSKTIFFTSIDLSEVKPGVFMGYGYDYWSSVAGSPSVNYRFIVKIDPSDSKKMKVQWSIFSLLRHASGDQAKRLSRDNYLQQKWVDFIEANEDTLPQLTYDYNMIVGG